MTKRISIVVPNYNGAASIGKCLEAALASEYENFEVIVVDDCSEDNSIDIIKQYPCKLIKLETRSGSSRARNTGARESGGEILFFIDADCLLEKDALAIASRFFEKNGPKTIIGGTYTKLPHDKGFFSAFQSAFIHYSELKHWENPDYLTTHALIMDAREFMDSSGFTEKFLPILEDVDFCHRMKRQGFRLLMSPDILVQHVFNFSLVKSLRNAIRKSTYWTVYSIRNRDLFTDSGTASVELKMNVVVFALSLFLLSFSLVFQNAVFLVLLFLALFMNMYVNRNLFSAFFKSMGLCTGLLALLYYTTLYAMAVGIGGSAGFIRHYFGIKT